MHRCYLAPERWQDGVLIPDREECHHMRDVLRVVPGDVVMLFDGAGRRVKAQVLPPATPEIKLEPLGEIELLSRPLPSISLMQAIPKGSRMETVVEKGTELGMNRLVPVVTARTITRLDEARARKRCQRWTRIALSAARSIVVVIITASAVGKLERGTDVDDRTIDIARLPDACLPLRGVTRNTEAAAKASKWQRHPSVP